MAKDYVIGIKSIKVGDIPDDGTMSDMLAPLGNTYKDSASLKMADPSIFNLMVEESDDPEAQAITKGAVTLAFSLPDHSPAVRVQVQGGSISEVDGAWEAPDTAPLIYKSVQIITKTDKLMEFPKMSIVGTDNDDLKSGGAGLIDVKATVMKPDGAGVPSRRFVAYQLPVVNAGNAQNLAAANGALAGQATAFRGTIVSQNWTCMSKPNGAADPGITTPNVLNTNITGLVSGVYKFTLAVSDSNGYENTATVTVTVVIAG